MSDQLATYSFLPWLRQGIANNIKQPDNDVSVILRASIEIQLTLSGTKRDGSGFTVTNPEIEPKKIELFGPGDIIGIDSRAIIKTEPRSWITNFEPNYLPYIDFYEEDFPWRYTPADPNGDRLRPWITLVVLKEDEFEDGANIKEKPLPFIKLKEGVKATDIFPKPSEIWAWAHVHVNTDLSNGAAPNTAHSDDVTNEISNIIKQNPDLAYSRIICPRKLEANVGYHAFLIPSFESGRLAGLGRPFPESTVPETNEVKVTLSATESAWDNESKFEFPYYHRWYFRTGNVGDFEYLVNLLEPKPADKTVGIRDMDVLHPGSNLPRIDNLDLKGILKLGGALRVPFDSMEEEDKLEVKKYDDWDESPYPQHPFTKAMAQRINLADDYTDDTKTIEQINKYMGITVENGNGDPDPVITSPLYGRWHALQQRLLFDKYGNNLPYNENWIHELNLDPRFRVAAGLGSKVIQKGQEEYMQAAWEQVGKIIEANNKIRLSQMAKEVSSRFYELHLKSLLTEKAFLFTSPVHKRVIYQNLTVHKQIDDSVIPPAVSSGTFRSIVRPRGVAMKKLAFDKRIRANNLIERINEGKVVIASPKVDPASAINLSDFGQAIKPKYIPDFVIPFLRKYRWLKYLPLIILLILFIIVLLLFKTAIGSSILVVVASGLIWIYTKLSKWDREASAVSQSSQTPEAVESYPTSPNFVISEPGSDFIPSKGSNDSEEAIRFKKALKDVFSLVDTKFPEPKRKKLELSEITKEVVNSINPASTIPKRTIDIIKLPPHIRANMVETFAPVMVYPEIDVPMYKPLADISSELFLPNLNKIEQNSITLLENNQKFIEAYMVGINHEMSRELLWREYPTDQRGTYFRQFWDVSSFLSQTFNSIEQLKDRYKRILDKRDNSNLRYYYSMLSDPTSALDGKFIKTAETVITKEELKDIYPLNFWSKTNTNKTNPSDPQAQRKNELGTHNQRAETSGKTQIVLVIRGELLKKYPTAVIYAQKADWGVNKNNGTKEVNEERVLILLNETEMQNPPKDKLKTPLFEAKIDPDIYFFGFDLDDEEARGTLNPSSTNDNPGWFFILKERPGEPRFGLDIEKTRNESEQIIFQNWNQLSWEHLSEIGAISLHGLIDLSKKISLTADPTSEDSQVTFWGDSNAAKLAYILYQVPVMVAVHASRMLSNLKE